MLFVKVSDSENEESVEIPVELHGYILMTTLRAQFPGACGLKFKTEQLSWRGVRVDERVIEDNNKLILYPSGNEKWNESIVYTVTYPKSINYQATAVKSTLTNLNGSLTSEDEDDDEKHLTKLSMISLLNKPKLKTKKLIDVKFYSRLPIFQDEECVQTISLRRIDDQYQIFADTFEKVFSISSLLGVNPIYLVHYKPTISNLLLTENDRKIYIEAEIIQTENFLGFLIVEKVSYSFLSKIYNFFPLTKIKNE